MFKKIGLNKMFLYFVGFIALVTLASGVVSFHTSGVIIGDLTELSKKGVGLLVEKNNMIKNFASLHSNLLSAVGETNPETQKGRIELFDLYIQELKTEIKACPDCSIVESKMNAYFDSLAKLKSDHIGKEAANLTVQYTLQTFVPMAEGVLDELDKLSSETRKRIDTESELQVVKYSKIRWGLLITLLISTLVLFTSGMYFRRFVIRAIDEVAKNLEKSTQQTSAMAEKLSSTSKNLSESTTQQASSIESTASSLEEITQMIAKASDSADSTAKTSTESQQKAEEGREAVEQMLTSINEISQSNDAFMMQVTDSNQQMADIVNVIQEIANKTKVINEIVFQTKLLSFNASVEAARAGEHGKGFSVVAQEVGSLAQMSGNAAKNISDLLQESIIKVEKIVNDTRSRVEVLVDQGKEKLETGVNVANQCSNLLNEIVKNVNEVSELAKDISVASKEQSQGVGAINKSMSQLDVVTQKNATTGEEAAGAAEELSSQAEALQNSVNDLLMTIHGKAWLEQKNAA